MAIRPSFRRLAWGLTVPIVLFVLLVATAGLDAEDRSHPRQAQQPAAQQAAKPTVVPIESKVDAVFARWTTTTPGCAVGVSVDDKVVLRRAYGMADLEHDVINTADTIFEAGSVSKQFTAAAVLLLVRDGKLALDDPVRKYVPELPDYGPPLTVRMMLQHTSGLRDWGAVAGIGGWSRTTRVYTHSHVVDIASRQRSLNFEPGSFWSYSNTGYNLSAVIVARLSGEPFAEFTRRRIFEPLGMTHTSWRDDFTRIVKGRAIAYAGQGSRFATLMPFENVHGNGGLLTTVGDLLAWNANFASHVIGDKEFVQLQEEPGRLGGRQRVDYGMGLFIGKYRGLREVYHSGSTAGYQAHLTRFPDQRLSVAVLCNVTSGAAGRYARAVADLYLGDRVKPETPVRGIVVPAEQLHPHAGLYRNTRTGAPMVVVPEKDTLRVDGALFVAQSPTRFVSVEGGRTLEFSEEFGAHLDAGNGTSLSFDRVPVAEPDARKLAEYAGIYTSDEAEVTMSAVVEDGQLRLRRRPDTTMVLRPLYADAFRAPLGIVIFRRGEGGRVTEFSVVQDRVWDLRFKRETPRPDTER